MKLTFLLIAAPVFAHCACLSIFSVRILAGDLADAVPPFRSIDPATQLGFAPLPGTQRLLSTGELALMLRQHGSEKPGNALQEVCLARFVRSITPAEIGQALESALNLADANIEIIDFSRQSLPPGRLEFRREALNKPPRAGPQTPVLWRGKLLYDEQSSASVWAKVRILVERPEFVAAGNIAAGAVVGSDQVQVTSSSQFPDFRLAPSSPASIVGKVARRNILKGEKFALDLLDDPPDVLRGERVQVKVLDGMACLFLDAVAQSSGKRGDKILLHNASSGRNFRAVIAQKGLVVVRSDGGGLN